MRAKKPVGIVTPVLVIAIMGSGLLIAMKKQKHYVVALAFSPDGKSLLVGEDDNTVKVRDVSTGKVLRTLSESARSRDHSITPAFGLSPDGKLIATLGRDGNSVGVWDVASGGLLYRLQPGWLSCSNLIFTSDGQAVLSGNMGLKVMDLTTGTTKLTIAKGIEGQIHGWAAISPDGQILAIRTVDTLTLWDMRTGKLLRRLQGGTNWMSGTATIAFSPAGELASGRDDGIIQIWNVHSGALKRQFFHGKQITELAYSPDSNLLAAGSLRNGVVKVWDARSGRLLHQLSQSSLRCLAFSPDSKTLVAGGANDAVTRWDVASGRVKNWPQ